MNESKQKWLKTLKKARLFSGLAMEEIEVLASAMFYSEFDENQTLVYEKEPGNELFIIVKGTIAVSVKSEGKEIELVRLGAGDFFGEMAMLEQELRSATCKAVEPVACLVLKSQDFSSLIIDQPKIAASVLNNMLKITSHRLVDTDSLLSQIIQWGDDAKKRAITDEFTGLYNRRYLDESFESLIKRGIRRHEDVNLAMVDIDHFGKLNKEYGAVFCDKILLAIADTFKRCFNSEDILIRYGGDEFCFIIQGVFERAEMQCKKVCENVNTLVFTEQPDLRVSCSIGLAHYTPGIAAAELLKLADNALYKAKEEGRNRTFILSNANGVA
ncbi:GGDEF domain-containing protein [Treponema pedis]|uniref:GGDEF domain-containing protein n=1 Tax=Treponema pedis TaxID=409322 RepID=UPI0003F80E2C|nr:GGDEF domain-containing protein [Treponema pedis]